MSLKRMVRWALLFCCIALVSCSHGKRVSKRAGHEESKEITRQEQSVQEKYAALLGVEETAIKNMALYEFVDAWMGVPYRYAGTTREGIDCSGFVGTLYRDVYHKNIPRMTSDINKACINLEKTRLEEGDIVFFDINGKKGSHVGVYLHNNRFVHASSSKGVMISNLTDVYYRETFSHGGRF